MEIKLLLQGHSIAYCNCYGILSDNAAIVVDPGKYSSAVAEFLKENAGKQRLILITHAHFDHIGGASRLREETGVKIAVCEDEAFALSDAKYNLSDRFRAGVEPFSADITLSDEQRFTVGDLTVTAMATPGHTAGSMSYLIDNTLFSGDTLFFETAGRTDLPGGDISEMKASLDRLMYMLDDSVVVYPGHGEHTTIGHERLYNPYLGIQL